MIMTFNFFSLNSQIKKLNKLFFIKRIVGMIKYVKKISPRAIFFIHGANDERIPVDEGEKLYNLAGEPKEFWIVSGADHMESHSKNPLEYERRVGEFFRKYLK